MQVQCMDVGEPSSTTSMDVVMVGLENPVDFKLGQILCRKIKIVFEKQPQMKNSTEFV